jgi:hypothetical protein
MSVLCSGGISAKYEELDIPSHYWTGVLSNSAIFLGLLNDPRNLFLNYYTYILSAVKPGLQSYCDTSYSRSGLNQMWIHTI